MCRKMEISMRWTSEEEKLLLDNSNLPIQELAALFPERTLDSVRAKLLRLTKKRKLIEWTREERLLLVDLVHKNTPLKEIYSAFPTRTPSAIRSQIHYLRKHQWDI